MKTSALSKVVLLAQGASAVLASAELELPVRSNQLQMPAFQGTTQASRLSATSGKAEDSTVNETRATGLRQASRKIIAATSLSSAKLTTEVTIAQKSDWTKPETLAEFKKLRSKVVLGRADAAEEKQYRKMQRERRALLKKDRLVEEFREQQRSKEITRALASLERLLVKPRTGYGSTSKD